jgi:hypothetical protein
MDMIFLGIDPGVSGAVAVLASGTWLIDDMPVLSRVVNGKRRSIYDETALLELVRKRAVIGDVVAFVEDVGGLPGQSAPRAFNFGFGCGLIRMALVAAGGVVIEPVRPQEWKGALRVPTDKKAAIARACELIPDQAHRFNGLAGGDEAQRSGRAEAALIALYGAKRRGFNV